MENSLPESPAGANVTQKTVRQALLQIIGNRTGGATRKEIITVMQSLYVRSDGSVPTRAFISNCLSRLVNEDMATCERWPGSGGRSRAKDVFTATGSKAPGHTGTLVFDSTAFKAAATVKLWPPVKDHHRKANPIHEQILRGIAA